MRSIIAALIIAMIICVATGCSNNIPNTVSSANDSAVEETPEEKEARLAEEKAKADAEKIAEEEEKIMLAKIKKSINSSVEECREIEDEFNNTFCFAEHGVMLMKQAKTDSNPHPVFSKEYHPVYNLCEYANNSDLCYFYAAVVLKAPGFCDKVEDKTGCELLSSHMFCRRMINPNQCLLDKATLMRFISKSAAKQICSQMDEFNKYPDAEKYNCSEIDFEEAEYDSEPFRDRFFLMYFMTKIMGFEVDKTTMREYVREMVEENEQD
ncbi:hypothetical protein KY338_01990 [Candidatus Woesearchaeota archaeon]|nr:hypothetical protein [Candidatus Woesearchaeota archaeon]MBW3005952.1 hypothetical protein [Candidatus Woesearchaeota archaeon]